METATARAAGPKSYAVSRMLRLALFSFVVACLVVSVFLVTFRFLYDPVAKSFGYPPFQMRPEFVVPAILVLTVSFMRVIRDMSEGRTARN